MAKRERPQSARRRAEPDRAEWVANARPMELRPVELRHEVGSEMPAVEVRAREIPLVNFGDKSAPARAIEEHRYDFRPVAETPIQLRREPEREFKLNPIPVTEAEMRELEARRLSSRDLGWNVSGTRIRSERDDER